MEGEVGTPPGRLHYRVDGPHDGPAVLLCHALGTTLDLWSAQIGTLARTFRVIRYDARGHGDSSVPAGEYTLDDLGEDAVRVLDAVGADEAHVCGISLGGLTGMWLGVTQPARVKSLVIANSAARVGTRERWVERIIKVRTSGMAAIADVAMTAWFTPGFRQREPGTVARFHRMVASCDPAGYIGCCAALRDADLREDIHRVRPRALVIAGDQDTSTTLADAEYIAAQIPGATLLTLPAAHLTNVECAASFSERADAFFSAFADLPHV